MRVTYEMYQRACAKYAEHGDMQDALETALCALPDPSETVVELNKRITALQQTLERVRGWMRDEAIEASAYDRLDNILGGA